jgi:hypothetical protein
VSQNGVQVDIGQILCSATNTWKGKVLGAARLEAGIAKAILMGGLTRGGRQLVTSHQAAVMTNEEERELRATLARLMQEHRDLDAAIEALQNAPGRDLLQIQRLKKRKLQLRDRISFIEDQLTPDIIA